LPPLVRGWQPAGAAGGGATTAAAVVGADAGFVGTAGGGAGACDVADVVCAGFGCAFRVVATAGAAWRLGAAVAVADGVVLKPVVVSPPGEEDDPPEFAATMMMISAAKAKMPVSALCRAGQDLPRGGGRGGCGPG
jgi:hypothetical protein